MFRVIYLSSATKLLSNDELSFLLRNAKIKNRKNNITGLLLYIDGDFLQVIEGEKKDVLNLFELIKIDERNRSIITVFSDDVDKRQFPNWLMGFSQLTYHDLQKIDSFENITKTTLSNIDDKVAITFINTFVKSHRNQISFI
ncbi:BLUF domain-containing protein [Flavobacterium sp.]|uniref:BLUF domain-containing protein n=1 Tax=Flavobacterium sp. TaxID=239 RepID=UPI00286A3177|nr:BLUF domain-containing protein [Flavobacterium sp.]